MPELKDFFNWIGDITASIAVAVAATVYVIQPVVEHVTRLFIR